MLRPKHDGPRGWAHWPWLLGLLIAPLLLGAVGPASQALVAALLAISGLLLSNQLGGFVRPLLPAWLKWCALAVLLAQLVPLPLPVLQGLSPERVALARAFPVDPVQPAGWLPITTSPAKTVERFWLLALLFAGFGLARLAAAELRSARPLVWVLGIGILLQAGCDVWYRLDPSNSPLGWWKPTWRDGAGTFVNRNDFANWLSVAALGAAGWVLRTMNPLRAARPDPTASVDRFPVEGLLLGGVVGFGLVMSVASGSRGGMLALLGGAAAFGTLLAHRSRSRTRLGVLSLLPLLALVVLLPAADLVLRRLAATHAEILTHHSKLDIWRQSVPLFFQFPLVGTGLGSFATVFNHFKTAGGLSTFTHAENDYLQALVETGLAGALLLLGLLVGGWRKLAGFVWRERMDEPELVFGATAALVAFAVHAGVEFVSEIPANALLAVTLLGFCVGSRDRCQRPVAPPPPPRWRVLLNLAGSALLLAFACVQIAAAWHWRQALRARTAQAQLDSIRASVSWWPGAIERRIARARVESSLLATLPPARQTAEAERLHADLNRALAWDPFNWELRLERAWLSLAFSTNSARARTEVWETVRLNPLQPQIPLQFAESLRARNPDLAVALLRAADFSSGEYLRDALDLCWRIQHQPERVWELTPNTVPALLALGDFAVEQKLLPLAAQAYQTLVGRFNPVVLAEKFLQAQRPDLALPLLTQSAMTPRARLVQAEAYVATGQYRQAIDCAENLWQSTPWRTRIESPAAGPSLPRTGPRSADRATALRQAEQEFLGPTENRDVARLRQWHEQFPDEPRLTWILYRTELTLGNLPAAARIAVQLAAQTAAIE